MNKLTKENNELTAKMYEMYSSGVSSTLVAMRFGITPQSVRGRFQKRGLKLRPRKIKPTERDRLIAFLKYLKIENSQIVDEYLKIK